MMLDALETFGLLPERLGPEEYNFEHFRTTHLLRDVVRTFKSKGIQPGQEAPDFALPDAEGGTFRLSEQAGKPVLLHFGSYT